MAEYDVPDDLQYTTEDEWMRVEGKRIVIGVTDYAQTQLGDIVFVELPEVGTSVEKGESFGTVESVKTVADLFAPISGEVVDVNDDLVDSPEVINQDCYGAGWIIAVAPEDDDRSGLLDAAAYRKHVEERSDD